MKSDLQYRKGEAPISSLALFMSGQKAKGDKEWKYSQNFEPFLSLSLKSKGGGDVHC